MSILTDTSYTLKSTIPPTDELDAPGPDGSTEIRAPFNLWKYHALIMKPLLPRQLVWILYPEAFAIDLLCKMFKNESDVLIQLFASVVPEISFTFFLSCRVHLPNPLLTLIIRGSVGAKYSSRDDLDCHISQTESVSVSAASSLKIKNGFARD